MTKALSSHARILVVEDETFLRATAVDILQDRGFRTIEANSAAEAIAILSDRYDVHVLFTDVHMPPGADGFDLAHEVHRRWPAVRLLVTSGNRANANRALPDDGRFIAKPYGADALSAKIDGMLNAGEPVRA